jgi:uncharacterized protein
MRDVFFGPENEKLNGVLISSDRSGAPAVVICHPHPQFGGSMNNNVVLGVEAALADADFTTLRFDFRGVGRSRGVYGDGVGEVDDVKRAVAFLAADSKVGKIYVVGYSFGAAVGLKAGVEDERVRAVVGIAPPTVMYSFDFLNCNSKPILITVGSLDEFCDVESVCQYVGPPGGRLEVVAGADHFFISVEDKIGTIVTDFLAGLEPN